MSAMAGVVIARGLSCVGGGDCDCARRCVIVCAGACSRGLGLGGARNCARGGGGGGVRAHDAVSRARIARGGGAGPDLLARMAGDGCARVARG